MRRIEARRIEARRIDIRPDGVLRLGVLHLGPPTLGGDDPYERVGDDFGTDVVRDPERDDLPGEGVAMTVGTAPDLPYEGRDGRVRAAEANVEEPGPGDRDVGDTVGADEVGPEDLGDLHRGTPGGPGQLQRDVRGVVPAATGPRRRHLRPHRHGHAQLPRVHSTTHRAQHGTGELDGGHVTSVGEEGGGYASRFAQRSGMWTGCGVVREAEAGVGRMGGPVVRSPAGVTGR